MKSRLYTALAHDGRTLKDWFVAQAESYLSSYSQLRLPLVADPEAPDYSQRRRKTRQ